MNIDQLRHRRVEVARTLAFLEADEQAYNKGLGEYIEDLRTEYLLLCHHIKEYTDALTVLNRSFDVV